MKKVALSLLAFALVGGAAFADATADVVKNPVTITLDVSATGGWGLDLDTKNHAFTVNGGSKALTLWFVNGSSAKTGEGDVHGYINVADVKFGYDDVAPATTFGTGSIGDVTAKVVAGDLYLKISTNTDPSQGFAADGDNDNGGATTTSDDTTGKLTAKYGATSTEWATGNPAGYSSFVGTGLEVGYAIPKVVTLIATAASNGNGAWANKDQVGYEAAIEADVTAVDKLTLNGKFYTGKSTDALNAAGVQLGYDLGVVAPYAHINYNLTDSVYDTDLGVKAPLADGLLIDAVVLASNTKASTDAAIGYTVTAKLAQSKLAGPFGLDAGFRQASLKAGNYEVFAKAGLKLTDTLAATGTADYYIDNGSTDASLFAKAQVEYTGISLTTVGVYWNSSDLGARKSTGDSKLGELVIKAKVAY